MKPMSSLHRCLNLPTATSPEAEDDKALVKRIVRRLSAGNVCLQMGWYTTEREINALREMVLSHDLMNPAETERCVRKKPPARNRDLGYETTIEYQA